MSQWRQVFVCMKSCVNVYRSREMHCPNVVEILALHQNSIPRWKDTGFQLTHEGFLGIAEQNHAFNLQLWHAEDRARRDDMGHEFVYQAKREIDHCNQARNNRVQDMDLWIIEALQPASPHECPVNSETPGMMI